MYWWAGLLVCLLFIAINVLIVLLRDKPQISYAIAYTISLFLLVYKLGEYVYWQAIGEHMKIPLEFSALSYLILGVTVTFRIKKLEQFGVLISIISGLMYSISFWISSTSFIVNMESPYLLTMSIINHHLLYLAGALLLFNVRKYSFKTCWIQFIGVGTLVGYSWLIYLFTPYAELYGKPIIIQICDGTILSFLGTNVPARVVTLFIGVSVVLLIGIIFGFYAIDNAMAKRRVKRGLPDNYAPKNWISIYKF